MRRWRVGTLTLGVLLIALGIIMLAAQLKQLMLLNVFLVWWPIILVLLGGEILWYICSSKEPEPKVRYDVFSMFIVFVLVFCSIGMYAVTSTGIMHRVTEAVSSHYFTVEVPRQAVAVETKVEQVIVRVPSGKVNIESADGQEVVLLGTATIRATGREQAEQLAAGVRLAGHIEGTAWNGVKVAFEELSRSMGGFYDIDMSYITVTIMGTGTVAMHAAKASSKYGDPGITEVMEDRQIPGVLVQLAGRTITRDSGAMEAIISSTDILVDATKRYNPTKPIISNRFIGLLPQHSIILDLSADPYNFNVDPIQVKGIEGIPTGSLDQYVFYPDDEVYDIIGQYVKTAHRRTVVSCNAWPGITPARCMETYGTQISRFFPVLFSKAADELSPQSDNPDERALARSTIRYFENHVLPSQLQTTML
jgi:hypothetical protein